jgi:Cu2+-containing amine oxidase
MFKQRWSTYAFASVAVVLLILTVAPAQRRDPLNNPANANPNPNPNPIPQPDPMNNAIAQPQKYGEVIQQFPSKGPMQTAWKVHWREENGSGLIIQDAFFKKSPNDPWMQVIGEARLAEAFVPYHRGSPRFWDVSYNFPLCDVTQADAGPHGVLLSSAPGKMPTVVMEVRDQGIAWKDSAGVRRGEQLVLWGTLSAANYRYIIEYTFRDDGLIRFNVGATGHNYPGSEWEPHMHNHYWRIDVNLDGPNNNTVELCEHIEPKPGGQKSQALTMHDPFNGGQEGFADFNSEKFTMLRIVNTQKKNIRGEPLAYDLVPYRMGNSRHFGSDKENCTHHDYYVTKSRPSEIYFTKIHDYIKSPNGQQPENVTDTDVVVWYSAPGHHEPRSEDGEMKVTGGGNRQFTGATPVMWCTFDLRPRNLWDHSPYFPR